MKFLTRLLLGAVLLGSFANLAHAQQADTSTAVNNNAPTHAVVLDDRQDDARGEDGDGQGRHHGGHGGRHVQILDLNGDGFFSADEAAAGADAAFNRLDRNGDGLISEGEFTMPRTHQHWCSAMFSASADADAAAVLKAKKERFATLDADNNGTVSHAEFLGDAQKRYELADTKKDGKVSPWAFRALGNL